MTETYRVVLVDDHVMFRGGVKRIVQGINGVEVVGEASDGLALLDLLKNTPADLVILDVSMPNLRGLEAAREIKIIKPEIKVLILTMHKEKDYLYHAFSAGAEGYLLKEDADTELINAVEAMRRGGTYVSPLLAAQITDLFLDRSRLSGEDIKFSGEVLTVREREVLKLIAEGKSSREVGALLFISNRTVQHHRANIMRKLNFKKTADLVKYAIQKGYTEPAT